MKRGRGYGRTARMKRVTNDAYMSPAELADYVGSLCIYPTRYVDPCAGDRALFDRLPEPKQASDITYDPPLDFLTSVRDDFAGSPAEQQQQPLTIVCNPPFTLPQSHRNGVVAFLNQAARLLLHGEHCVCVAPATMRKWVNIRRVAPCLHLLEEHVFRRAQVFTERGRKVKVTVVIQVWRKDDTRPRDQPQLETSHPDFRLSFQFRPGATFFMNVWGVSARIGRVTWERPVRDGNRWRTPVGTLPTRKSGGGTAICVYVTGDGAPDTIFRRLLELHEQGAWRAYTLLCGAGHDNPVITSKDIYTMVARGPAYLDKANYARVIIID